MLINLIQDTVGQNGSAPAYFMKDMQTAADMFDSMFTNNVTINLHVGWGSANNVVDNNLTGSGGAYATGINGQLVQFSTLSNWLIASEHSANDIQAYSTLAGLGLSGSQNIYVDSAQEKALGHYTGSSSAVDGYAAFGTGISDSLLVGVALHEFAHALGRNTINYTGNPTIMDLFRYGSSGHLQWQESGGQQAYFSINGGATDVADFSTTSDYGDLSNSSSLSTNDPFNAFYNSSTTQSLTALDKEIMDILGFNTSFGTAGDFNGDGKSDILWQAPNGGQVYEWQMNGTQVTSSAAIGGGAGWTVAGIGDFNGDGKSDILWQAPNGGQVYEWQMNGTQVISSNSIGGGGGWAPLVPTTSAGAHGSVPAAPGVGAGVNTALLAQYMAAGTDNQGLGSSPIVISPLSSDIFNHDWLV
jgi:serralysin